MKLQFKNGRVANYSFRELDYALVVLNKQVEQVHKEMGILRKYRIDSWRIKDLQSQLLQPIEEKIRIVEDELMNRMLTGNDDGMVDRELLGDVCEQN